MDTATIWYLIVGFVFIVMALATTLLTKLPLTSSLLYLLVGVGIGPHGLALLDLDIIDDAELLKRLTEIAVIVSLFTAGLKLRFDWHDRRWWLPIRLAFVSMALTVGLIALTGVVALGLSVGAAVVLGAVLAPTDPVLAAEVQVSDPDDQDRLRFGLTGEAGLNDGTAFPFVMLGLGLMSLHDIGPAGLNWLAIDLLWAVVAGLAIGAVTGVAIGGLVVFLRREYGAALGLDDFLALGSIALAYGAAHVIHAYGFLAVFTAGLALRYVEQKTTDVPLEEIVDTVETGDASVATDAKTAPAYMAQSVLGFNEQLERIGAVIVVVLVGSLLSFDVIPLAAWWFVPLVLLGIRPVAAWIGTYGSPIAPVQRRLIAWFGIRGIGSIYYLMYAIGYGIADETALQIAGLTLAMIAVSVTVHGITVTPLMMWYHARFRRERHATPSVDEGR